jgi:hypothetical protein
MHVNACSLGVPLSCGWILKMPLKMSNDLRTQAAECLRRLRTVRDRAERDRLLVLMQELAAKADALDQARRADRIADEPKKGRG